MVGVTVSFCVRFENAKTNGKELEEEGNRDANGFVVHDIRSCHSVQISFCFSHTESLVVRKS